MVYLDSAATTLQKPPTVARAVRSAMGRMASPGRGGHKPAMLAAKTAFDCRETAAGFFHLDDPENVVFTLNATHALNLAIKSIVKPKDTVVISGYEHNAVTRPLQALGCRVKVAKGPLFEPEVILARFEQLITEEVSCVVCTHVSNVFACKGDRPAMSAKEGPLYSGRFPISRCIAGAHGSVGRSVHRYAWAQGLIWPAGDRSAALRGRPRDPASSGGGDGKPVRPARYAGLFAG